MTDLETPLASFPSRRFELSELDDLEANDRFIVVLSDEQMNDVEGSYVFVWNCVFVTRETVSAAVFVEDEETWYRVYKRPRDAAVLTDAYDAVREVRGEESLFDRGPLSVSEAVFAANRPSGAETSGYEEGDAFDCPVCGDTHTVKFDEDEIMKGHETDTSVLSVDCPDASAGKMYVEFQARTGG